MNSSYEKSQLVFSHKYSIIRIFLISSFVKLYKFSTLASIYLFFKGLENGSHQQIFNYFYSGP